jgi:hypothetical protein
MKESDQLHASAAISPRKEPIIPIEWEAVWAVWIHAVSPISSVYCFTLNARFLMS